MGGKKPRRKAGKQPGMSAWTGFRDKTLWDWLQLLVVPLALAFLGFLFAMQQDARQQAVDQDTQLQAYLDQMSTLLIDEDLRISEEVSEVRTLARARTLTLLESLDPSRRARVLQFLAEAELVQSVNGEGPVISLADANLHGVHLAGANLQGAQLHRANLTDAYLVGADLTKASLTAATLRNTQLGRDANPETGALLTEADLTLSDLRGANLGGVYLNNANLQMASLSNADLTKADLTDANVSQEQLEQASSLEGATMPSGRKRED